MDQVFVLEEENPTDARRRMLARANTLISSVDDRSLNFPLRLAQLPTKDSES